MNDSVQESLIKLRDVTVPTIQQTIDQIVGASEWVADKDYPADSRVYLKDTGFVYTARANAIAGCHPNNVMYWKKGESFEKLPALIAQAATDIVLLKEAIELLKVAGLNQEIIDLVTDLVQVSVADIQKALEILQLDLSQLALNTNVAISEIRNEISIQATAINQVQASVEVIDGKVTTTVASITALETRLAGDEFATTAKLLEYNQVLSNQINSVATSVTRLETSFNTSNAAIERKLQTVASQSAASASAVESLTANMGQYLTGAEFDQYKLVQATENDALAQKVENISATVADNSAAVNMQIKTVADQSSAVAMESRQLAARMEGTEASLAQTNTAIVTATEAMVQQRTEINASIDNVNSLIVQETTARVCAEEALLRQVDQMIVEFGRAFSSIHIGSVAPEDPQLDKLWIDTLNGNQLKRWNGTVWEDISDRAIAANAAAIVAEKEARISQDAALAQQQTTMIAMIDGNAAAISDVARVQATADAAQTEKISNLTARVGNTETGIQTTQRSVVSLEGKINSEYSVMLRGSSASGYKFAGFKLGMTGSGTTVTSEFGVTADRFIVYPSVTSSAKVAPFIIENNQVKINSALIGTLTVDFANVTGHLQSDNFNAVNKTGWQLRRDGTFMIYAGKSAEGYTQIDAKGVRVYDGSGRLRVALGDLRDLP